MASAYDYLLIEDAGPATIITLNRPNKRNALSCQTLYELSAALRDAASSMSGRCVIISAAGSVFSAGHDLNELAGQQDEDYIRLFSA